MTYINTNKEAVDRLLDRMGRVPPDEGQLYFVGDVNGNVENVSDEDLEAASQWFNERFGESREVGQIADRPRGYQSHKYHGDRPRQEQ